MFFSTWGSTIIITLLLALVGFKYYYKPFCNSLANDPFTETEYPQYITGLGVLGTFMGITIGLLGFEPSDLQKSIPILLDGMKTAFITSITGMVVSISMILKQKKKQKEYISPSPNTVNEDVTIADLLRYLQEQNEYQKEQNIKMFEVMASNNELLQNTIKSSLEQMTKSIVGDGESTLITQLKLMRGESNDNQRALKEEIQNSNNELITEFKNFANYMTENTNKAFIKALEDVIRDFNSNLTEQFGENFKHLNTAVGKLLDWQEQYKSIIIEVTENQKHIFSGIEQAKKSLENMALNSSYIQDSAEKLSNIVITTSAYHQIIEKSLSELADISKQAYEFIPSLEGLTTTLCQNIDIATQKSTESIISSTENHYNKIQESLNKTTESQITTSKLIQKNSTELLQQADTYLNKITLNSKESLDIIEKQMNVSVESFNNLTMANIDNMNKQIELIKLASDRLENNALEVTKRISDNIHNMVENSNENLKTSMENINNSLEVTLNNSLKTLGNQLGSISQKFAKDYIPLTEKLKEIIEIANKIK